MTTYLGKSCSFGLLRGAFRKLPSIYVFSYFPFGFEGRMWDLIVSIPDHCLSFYLTNLDNYLTYGFDCQRFTGINNTNLIILKFFSRFLITTFLFVT